MSKSLNGPGGLVAAVALVLLFVALNFNVAQLPYPHWFKVVILTAIPLAIGAALLISARPRVIPSPVTG